MKNIIQNLYELHLTSDPFPLGIPNKNNLNEECELYSYLYENLPEEYKEKFFQYANLRTLRQNEEAKAAYVSGFKTATKLLVDSLK